MSDDISDMTPDDGQGVDLSGSSWGEGGNEVSSRALRKLNALLRFTDTAGEVLIYCLLAAIAVALVWVLFYVNYGDIVLNDGTMFHCVLDGMSGEVYAPKQ